MTVAALPGPLRHRTPPIFRIIAVVPVMRLPAALPIYPQFESNLSYEIEYR
jgi:hypothetical protein